MFKFVGLKDEADPEKKRAVKVVAKLHLEGLEKTEGEL